MKGVRFGLRGRPPTRPQTIVSQAIKTGMIRQYSESYAEKWVRNALRSGEFDADDVKLFKKQMRKLKVSKSEQANYIQALRLSNKKAEEMLNAQATEVRKKATQLFPKWFDKNGEVKPMYRDAYIAFSQKTQPFYQPKIYDLSFKSTYALKKLNKGLYEFTASRILTSTKAGLREQFIDNYIMAVDKVLKGRGIDSKVDKFISDLRNSNSMALDVFSHTQGGSIEYIYSDADAKVKLAQMNVDLNYANNLVK